MYALKLSSDLTGCHAHGFAWAWKTCANMATPGNGHGTLWFTINAIILIGIFPCSFSLAQSPGWEYQPYRVHCIVALDVPGGVSEQLTAMLPTYLNRRATAAIGSLWLLNVEVATGVARQRI